MRINDISSCYIRPEISPEQFIAEHFFIYIAKGRIHGYDGHQSVTLEAGQYALVRKNHLARYNKEKINGKFEKVVIILDQAFLKGIPFAKLSDPLATKSACAFLGLPPDKRIHDFLLSLVRHYDGAGKIFAEVANHKRLQLIDILLKIQPELRQILFDFGQPEKIDLEAFMNRHYRFNTSIERFAVLTGRSRSAFKRDFKAVFNETPSRWLIKKRLQEAYFLISKKHSRPSEIYLDLGFENLSHFSYAFKKAFGQNVTQLLTEIK